jgi:ribosomal protein S18 acetylase RimI-like enzyme
MEIVVERVEPRHAILYKDTRLRALQDSPWAYGSTYARESQFPEEEWLRRSSHGSGAGPALFLAFDGPNPCGMAGIVPDTVDFARASVVSVWTAPSHRRRGVACRLFRELAAWAHARGIATLYLTATSDNAVAIACYQRMGFRLTGRTEPYPNDPARLESEMCAGIDSLKFACS